VLGAGPAGASAAFFLSHLSEGKLNVLSLEKLDRNFDRYHHMCGEAVSRRTFDDLSPLAPEAVTFEISRAIEHWPGGLELETPSQGYVLDRPLFLRRLLDRAVNEGCHLDQGSAISIVRENDRYTVRTRGGKEYRCRWLVGADGWNSLVRRTFFPGGPRLLWAEQYVTEERTERDVMHFHYDQRYLGGYRWVFPHEKGSRVGFTRGTEPRPKALERQGRAIPYDYHETVSGNACLVGDAAGQANPLTFGGIRAGMVAGKMAAQAILKGDLSSYSKRWERSPYSLPIYIQAFDILKGMDNAALIRAMRPFRKGYGRMAGLRAMMMGKENRELFRACGKAAKWGW
jgi:digeranylgeranylglycerophospholipid reductase